MNKAYKKLAIAAGAATVGFLVWRFVIKPRVVEKRVKKFNESYDRFDLIAQALPEAEEQQSPAIYDNDFNDFT